jgi:hypothetical protein
VHEQARDYVKEVQEGFAAEVAELGEEEVVVSYMDTLVNDTGTHVIDMCTHSSTSWSLLTPS